MAMCEKWNRDYERYSSAKCEMELHVHEAGKCCSLMV